MASSGEMSILPWASLPGQQVVCPQHLPHSNYLVFTRTSPDSQQAAPACDAVCTDRSTCPHAAQRVTFTRGYHRAPGCKPSATANCQEERGEQWGTRSPLLEAIPPRELSEHPAGGLRVLPCSRLCPRGTERCCSGSGRGRRAEAG